MSATWTLGANLGLFVDRDDGAARASEIDSHTVSGLFSAGIGLHTSTLACRRSAATAAGKSVYGSSGRSMGNDMRSTATSPTPTNAPWRVRYDYDFVGPAGPAWIGMVRYGHGSNATTKAGSGGKEWERDVELRLHRAERSAGAAQRAPTTPATDAASTATSTRRGWW